MKRLALALVLFAFIAGGSAGAADFWPQATYTITGATVESGLACGDANDLLSAVLLHKIYATATGPRWYRAEELVSFQVISVVGPGRRYGNYLYFEPAAIGDKLEILGINREPCGDVMPRIVADVEQVTLLWVPRLAK